MSARRVLVALTVLAIALTSVTSGAVPPARAQTEVDKAKAQVDKAKQQSDEAKHLVSSSVADRAQVETELFAAIQHYQDTQQALATADARLSNISQQLSFATAAAAGASQDLQQQAVAAYMSAIVAPNTLMLSTGSMEQVMVADSVFRSTSADTLGRLDELAVQEHQLSGLQTRFQQERQVVVQLQDQAKAESDRLQTLYDKADAAVAAAYRKAQAAESAYKQATNDLAQAKAREEQRRLQEEEAKRRARQAAGKSHGSLKPAVEAWRSTVSRYFPARLVDEALQVMQCESGGNPQAVNPYSGASGLFQFLPGTWAIASVRAGVASAGVFNGEANIAAAAWLTSAYEARGYDTWMAWSCKPW